MVMLESRPTSQASVARFSRIPTETKPRFGPVWLGEAWARDDGLVLNLPIFKGCGIEFKRRILAAIRRMEFEVRGQETWYDKEYEEILTLQILPEDRLPPLRLDLIGQALEPGEYVCRGGDYDTRLVVVLGGQLEKLVGDAPSGGRCIVRTLYRGDCEGITEFLGVGSEQRSCALRAGPGGAKVRFVTRESVLRLLDQQTTDQGPENFGEPVPRWPQEVAYFSELYLDRIDSLTHKAAKELLSWNPNGDDTPLEYLRLPGQSIFQIDNGLGTTTSGPLPAGMEERFFFDGQEVIQPGIPGDCCIMILRGEVEADVPPGCAGQCLPRKFKPSGEGCWLGTGRNQPRRKPSKESVPCDTLVPGDKDIFTLTRNLSNSQLAMVKALSTTIRDRQVGLVTLVAPQHVKRARKVIRAAEDAKQLDLSGQRTSDWTWSWDDPEALRAIDALREANLLSTLGKEKAEKVYDHQHPPPPPPHPEPQAVLGSGSIIGQLALLGVPVVLGGAVRARGPVLVAVLHRHVLQEALRGLPELSFFERKGLTRKDWVRVLSRPPPHKVQLVERARHLGPVTGPPQHLHKVAGPPPAAAGSFAAFSLEDSQYRGNSGADALDYGMLDSIRKSNFIWEIINDAPARLLEALVREFEPRWLLPGEVVVVDEEPNADFMFLVVHGRLVVTLEGAEIERIGQGATQGFMQLLSLGDWTRTVAVDKTQKGEAMIQILRRERLIEIVTGHPSPKGHLRSIEDDLREARGTDSSVLERIPAFQSASGGVGAAFLSRIYKDADIRLFCPGDFLAVEGDKAASMCVVLAGHARGEHPQTLFFVELARGDWCFHNNILGVEEHRAFDLVAVTHVMVAVLYRHAMLNSLVAYPGAREVVLENEVWRKDPTIPRIANHSLFQGLGPEVIRRIEKEARARYYKKDSILVEQGGTVADDALLFILRGQARVSILGIQTRVLDPGDVIGLHRFLGLPAGPSQATIIAMSPCDVMSIERDTMARVLEEEKFEHEVEKFKTAVSVLNGGPVLDAFGLPAGGKAAKFVPECIEKSEVFEACSTQFVAQIPRLVEERAYWPGDKLFIQYDPGEFMFFLQSGRVRLEVLGRKEDEEVDTGSTLADMACLQQVPHNTETAVAATHVWARVLHRSLLQRALSSFPEEEKRLHGEVHKKNMGLFDD